MTFHSSWPYAPLFLCTQMPQRLTRCFIVSLSHPSHSATLEASTGKQIHHNAMKRVSRFLKVIGHPRR